MLFNWVGFGVYWDWDWDGGLFKILFCELYLVGVGGGFGWFILKVVG